MWTYAYGKDTEAYRYAQHLASVDNQWERFDRYGWGVGEDFKASISGLSWHERRLALLRHLNMLSRPASLGSWHKVGVVVVQHLERLRHVVDLCANRDSLLQDNSLGLKCQDFKEALATAAKLGDVLVYCDPPYQGTGRYHGVSEFNHEEFWEQLRNLPPHVKVLVSEESAPEDFVRVWSKQKARSMSPQGISMYAVEGLYTRR